VGVFVRFAVTTTSLLTCKKVGSELIVGAAGATVVGVRIRMCLNRRVGWCVPSSSGVLAAVG
jgi:hypothetical protein